MTTPPAEVYIYRDTDGPPGDAGPASPGPDENDPAYWYDLPGASGPGGTEGSQGSGDGTSHVLNNIRGPFEPLVSSADPPGPPPRGSASSATEPVPDTAHPAEADPAGHDQGVAHERKLEQIKDLYLTAGAIGYPSRQ